jgi:hypothetical protein
LIGFVAAVLLSLMALGQPVLADVIAPEVECCSVAPSEPVSAAGEIVEGVPDVIYRGGGRSPSNLRLRDGEDALSFRDSISNPMAPGHPVMHPGREYVALDTSMLPRGSVVPDGVPGSAVTPPGHVSVFVDDVDVLRAAIIQEGKFPK